MLEPILDFIKRYQWQLVAVSLTIFAIQSAANRKKGKKGDLQGVASMEAELEASIDAAEKD